MPAPPPSPADPRAPPAVHVGAAPNQGGSVASGSGERVRDDRHRDGSRPAERTDDERAQDAKTDQIHFYAKACAVISQARMTALDDSASPVLSSVDRAPVPAVTRTGKKLNKWFNLELEETDLFRTELKTWRSVSSRLSQDDPATSGPALVPPMVLDIVLDTSGMTASQYLVLSDQRGRRSRVNLTPSSYPTNRPASPAPGVRSPRAASRPNIVLETWTLSFAPATPAPPPELPAVYKNAITVFRSLFMTTRVLPVWSLFQKLARRPPLVGIKAGVGLSIDCRVGTDGPALASGPQIGLAVPISISEQEGEPVTETMRFTPVMTPLGSLHLSCTYRVNTDFSIDDIEMALSSRFIDEDFFKPTHGRYADPPMRPGSLPSRTPMPSVPPSALRSVSSTNMALAAPASSYGSLSSRHPVPLVPVVFPSAPVDPRSIPLPSAAPSPAPSTGTEGSRYGSYPAGGVCNPGVEPAFVSLERARLASLNVGGSAIRRNSITSQGRRTSFGRAYSPSSSSPIFRAGSYSSSPQPQSYGFPLPPSSGIARLSSSPSSPSFGGAGPGGRASSVPHVTSLLSFGSRSPLAPAPMSNQPSGIAFNAPRRMSLDPTTSSSAIANPPSSPYTMASGTQAMPIMRQYSSPSFSSANRQSRSYGAGSSFGSPHSNDPPSMQWSGPESLGRRAARVNYDARTNAQSSGSSEQKTFLAGAADDTADINAFLGLLDSRPDLTRAGESMSGGDRYGNSMMMSKVQVEEELRKLGEDFSRTEGLGTVAGGLSATGGLGITARRASLRKQPSKLSIEEEEPGLVGAGTSGDLKPRIQLRPSPATRVDSKASPDSITGPRNIASAARFYSPTPSTSLDSSPGPPGLAFPQYISRTSRQNVTTGFDLRASSASLASVASVASNLSELGARSSEVDFGCEEAVGRLELSDEDVPTVQPEFPISPLPLPLVLPPLISTVDRERGRHYSGSQPSHSRDPTPGPPVADGFEARSAPTLQFRRGVGRAMGYFAGRDRASDCDEEEIDWMA